MNLADGLSWPPEELAGAVGDGSFKAVGDAFLRHVVEVGQLQPDERVLDVGCGVGRVAIPLTTYLNERGRYEGFDVVPEGVTWCNENITPRYPNFRFRIADVYNELYNPEATQKATDYRFLYVDESFDFVLLTSVFTHMFPDEIDNYMSEIARVLGPGGRCLITYFILNQESRHLLAEGRSVVTFPHDRGIYSLHSETSPEHAVAYDEQFIVDLYKKHGLVIQQPLRYGAWCGRAEYLDGQDIIVASKPRQS